MQVSIKTISGRLCTVIQGDEPFLGGELSSWAGIVEHDYGYYLLDGNILVATALFALPRKPKPEDARLLYRYMAEGLRVAGTYDKESYEYLDERPIMIKAQTVFIYGISNNFEITHCLDDELSEKVAVAIEDTQP